MLYDLAILHFILLFFLPLSYAALAGLELTKICLPPKSLGKSRAATMLRGRIRHFKSRRRDTCTPC